MQVFMELNDFLIKHKLRSLDINMDDLVGKMTDEMVNGLEGKESSLRMIPTYIEADNEFLTEVPVLAIDAGGTNFRAALVKFTSAGKLEMGEMVTGRMPGLDREYSSREFFGTFAAYIKDLADKTDRIGFCFSYPTEIFPDKDGRLIQFCKEVQAPEVVGQLIGKRLLETLGNPDKKIVLLNDTVATLLAGKSASFGKSYDSFIGFILGTGTNTCYTEYNKNILKNNNLDRSRSMIINIESGNFSKAPRTNIDISFDNTTANPGNYSFEKMFSGGYFGGLSLTTLKAAAAEGLFSAVCAEAVKKCSELSSVDAGRMAADPGAATAIFGNSFKVASDCEICSAIIDNLIDRSSRLVAANIAAVVLKTDKGRSSENPVLITIEGTTFYKLHNLKPRFENYLSEYLSGDRKRYVEYTEVGQSSLIGAALAALID
jgi:hexokinase